MDDKYIIDRVPVRKTFGQYTKLSADGSFWWGNCPLCKEEDNSFLVSTINKQFYCYACKASGNAIDFLVQLNSISSTAARQELINTWGIHVPCEPGEVLNDLAKKFGPVLKKLAKT